MARGKSRARCRNRTELSRKNISLITKEDGMQKITLIIAAIVPFLLATSAGAAELKLFGGGHFQGSGKGVAEAFTKSTGIAATYTPGNTGGGGMARRLKAGEQMDVILMTSDNMENQVKAGLIKADSVVEFARDGMGVAVLK